MKKIFIFILCSFIFSAIFAQKKKKRSGYGTKMEYLNSLQLTAGTGTSTYYGDLCDDVDCMVFRPQASFGIMYRNTKRLLLRNEFHYIRLFGTDEGGLNSSRNLHFRSTNLEISYSVLYDIIPYERRFRYRTPITPYIFGGFGFTFFSPKAKIDGKWEKLRPIRTEGKKYGIVTPIVSYGFGMRYKISSRMNLSSEIGYRWTFTDYLDDVSTTYIGTENFTDETAARLADRTNETGKVIRSKNFNQNTKTWNDGQQRGNPSKNDGYLTVGLKLEYRIKYTSQTGKFGKFR